MCKKEEIKKLVDSFESEAQKLGYHVLVVTQSENHIVSFRTEDCPVHSVIPHIDKFFIGVSKMKD